MYSQGGTSQVWHYMFHFIYCILPSWHDFDGPRIMYGAWLLTLQGACWCSSPHLYLCVQRSATMYV